MAVYTSYDMIRDCQRDRPAGWLYLAETIAPALSRLLAHYGGGGVLERALAQLRAGSGPLQSMAPCHEREFLFRLRPWILALTAQPEGGASPDFDAVTGALEPLTATERQMVWLETFGYDDERAATLLRAAPATVSELRRRAGGLLRGALDDWSVTLLATHGRALGREAEARPPAEPLEFRHFLDVIDGRITWERRQAFERALGASWYEVHRACQIREVDAALGEAPPLAPDMHSRCLAALSVSAPKPPLWKRLFASRG